MKVRKYASFPVQCDALLTARFYIRQLDEDAVFSISVTNEKEEDASLLNIYVPTREARRKLEAALFPDRLPHDTGGYYSSYRVNTLLVSFIEERTTDD